MTLRFPRALILGLCVVAPIVNAAPDAGIALAPHIAPMFEKGRTWVFDTAFTSWKTDVEKATARAKVTCKVVSVTPSKRFVLSHVTCSKLDVLGRKFPVPGYYVGTAAGLWYLPANDDKEPTADDIHSRLAEPPTIASAPKPFEKVSKDSIESRPYIDGLRPSAKGDGWCVYSDTSKLADGGHTSLCYLNGIGIESGFDDVGGELARLEYTARR